MIQRENLAAAVAPANWVLRCPKVLRHQRWFPLLFLDSCSALRMVVILAVWSVTIGVFFEYIDLLISLLHFFFWSCRCDHRKPKTSHAFILSSIQPKLVEVLRTDHLRSTCLHFESVSFTVAKSIFCVASLRRASFALPLSCCSGDVPNILPRVGHFTRMEAASESRSHLCFILRCICSSNEGTRVSIAKSTSTNAMDVT